MYERPQSYYDSMDLEPEQIMTYLAMGRRKPQNKYEEQLLKESREISRKGRSLDIPFNAL